MAETTIAIQARGLSRLFGNRAVFRDVDLDVAQGQSVALRGANGAGKTTLLRCLASALRPSTGEVRWFGRPAAANPAARRLIAWVAHETLLYPHLTVRENLTFAARMCDVPRPLQRADQWLRNIGLQAHAHRLPAEISKGMRQRLSVARALVHDPRILLFDEPFSSLDAAGADWLLDLLGQLLRRGRTLCFATHDLQTARRLANRVLYLQSGLLQDVETGGSLSPKENLGAKRAA